MPSVLTTCLAALCTIGCSGGPGGGDDAATDAPDADDGLEIEGPAPPEPPAPPVFTPCPDGWREVEDPDTGIVTCEPWPEGGPEECGADEAHFPGEPGCVRIGSACPAGDWAEDLPTDREVLYVRAGEPGGGDGTIGSPFGTIAEAVAAADPLTVIALSKGTFDGQVSLLTGLTLWGACVAGTLVTCTAPADFFGTINVMRSGIGIRNLTVSGDRPGIWLVGASRDVLIEDVVVSQTTRLGVIVEEGRAVLRNVVVRDINPDRDGTSGRGLIVQAGGTVELERGVFERNRDTSISAYGAGTSVVARDVAVRDTLSRASDQTWGNGLHVQDGAHVELTRAVIEESREAGIQVMLSGASLDLVDVVVRDSLGSDLDDDDGRGIGVELGARARLTRCVFERNRKYGVFVINPETALEMTDVVVRDTRHWLREDSVGLGLAVYGGGRCTATRSLIARNELMGALVEGEGSMLALTDVIVSGTRPREMNGDGGRGLFVTAGGQVDIVRALFDGNSEISIVVESAGSHLLMTDATVRDTQPSPIERHWGRGLAVTLGARAEVSRSLFEGNRELTISVYRPDTVLVLTDVSVLDTLERACAVDTCAGDGAGIGIGAYWGGHVDASRFLITRSALCGIQLAYGRESGSVEDPPLGTMDLRDGEVSHQPVGANVHDADFDLDRLMDNVLYLDNGTNLDMDVLPVPEMGLEEL